MKSQKYELLSDRTEKYKPRYFVLAFRVYKITKSIRNAIEYFSKKFSGLMINYYYS